MYNVHKKIPVEREMGKDEKRQRVREKGGGDRKRRERVRERRERGWERVTD